MMRVSTLDLFNQAIRSFNQQESILLRLQEQMSSGKAILKSGDDPLGMIRIERISNEISQYQQYLVNINKARSSLELEESTLANVTQNYQRTRELIIAAGNNALKFEDKQAIATELKEQLEELKQIANTRAANGNYIFSGFKTQSPTIHVDTQGQYQFLGDEGNKTSLISPVTALQITDSGKEIFFNLPSSEFKVITTPGSAIYHSPTTGLVNSGTLVSMMEHDLTIDNQTIFPSVGDGVSSTDAAASAIAFANAINSNSNSHQVTAAANPNIVNLGSYTQGALMANELVINGISVTEIVGDESLLLAAINHHSEETGVYATQPGGLGTDVILTADDGRNIQLQTQGGSLATFSHFDLSGASLDQVQQSSIRLSAARDFLVGGANPQVAGLMSGIVEKINNTGAVAISWQQVTGSIEQPETSYTVEFSSNGDHFSIYSNTNPNQPVKGYDEVDYIAGQRYLFNGIEISFQGIPNEGDRFYIETPSMGRQDIFTSIETFIKRLQTTDNAEQLSYEIGTALNHMDAAISQLSMIRASVGARLNVAEAQKNYLSNTNLLAEKARSEIQDLDFSRAITLFSQYTTSLQAAQQSFYKLHQISLFNYL